MYCKLDKAKIDRIVKEHLIGGKVVEEYLIGEDLWGEAITPCEMRKQMGMECDES
jgi:(2Fe-2S) ferredoxin